MRLQDVRRVPPLPPRCDAGGARVSRRSGGVPGVAAEAWVPFVGVTFVCEAGATATPSVCLV